ncbi:MAG TPA: tetratricopeptide repeat protein, partial [Kofleriaceae bacterium]
ILAVAPIAAHGEDAATTIPAKARTLAERGRAAHDAGDYSGAIAAFIQAYVMAPSPALLFNLAQAYRLQGDCDDAALMYRRFLATNPEPEQRALAETHLASVERCMHKIALHIPIETAPDRSMVPAAAPVLTATTPAVPAVSRRAQIEKDVGVGLAIGGGVSLAVAAYYAVQAHDASNDVAAAYARGDKWQQIAPIDDRGQSAATKAKLFGAGGAVGIVGGIVTYLLGRRDEGPPVTVATTPHGLEVGVRWKY